MSTYVNHRGEYHGTNIGLTFGATMGFVLGLAAIATITMPYWGLAATSNLATLAAFAATPLGIGVLVTFAVSFALLAGSMIYGVIKNNEISEMKGPKIVTYNGYDALLVTMEDYEFIKENLKDHNNIEEFRIALATSKHKGVYIAGKYANALELGDSMIIKIAVKGSDGNIIDGASLHETLGFKEGSCECPIDILPSSKVATPKAEAQGEGKGLKQS